MSNDIQVTAQMNPIGGGLFNFGSFNEAMHAAQVLSQSSIVPIAYRAYVEKKSFGKGTGQYDENPNAAANCLVALNMANRMGADPLMIMQNLYIIEGRPAWSSQFIIAAINSCGRFTALRFEITKGDKKDVTYQVAEWKNKEKTMVNKTESINEMSCIAWATEKSTGERIESSPITMELAIKEGWYQKSGSKWQTMPEQMLRYRAAAFFGRIYAPELLMGIQTKEEIDDVSETKDVTANRAKSDIGASINSLLETLPDVPEEPIAPNYDITSLLAKIDGMQTLKDTLDVAEEINQAKNSRATVLQPEDLKIMQIAWTAKKKQVVTATEYQNIMQQVNDCQDLESADRLKSVIDDKASDFGDAAQSLYDKLELVTEEIGAQG